MKNLLVILCVLLLPACQTGHAISQLSQDVAALQEKPYLTPEDGELLAADVDALEAAWEADKEAGKGFLEGLSGAEAGGGLLGIVGVAVAAANAYRNRRLPGTTRLPEKG